MEMLALEMGTRPEETLPAGSVEHTVGVVGQEDRVGLAAIIEDDSLGVLGQQLNEHLCLPGVAGGEGGVANLHGLIVEAVGESACPGRALHAVFGHIDPVGQAVQIGTAAEHHRGRSQCAGAAPALLEVEPGVNVQVNGQRPRQTGHQ